MIGSQITALESKFIHGNQGYEKTVRAHDGGSGAAPKLARMDEAARMRLAAKAMPQGDPQLGRGQLNLGGLIAAGVAAQEALSRLGIGPVRVLNIATHRNRLVIEIQHFAALDGLPKIIQYPAEDGAALAALRAGDAAWVVWQAPRRGG